MMIQRIYKILAVLFIVVCVQSCAVGPDYKKPEMSNDRSFRYSTETDSLINLKWWEVFNDTILNNLIHLMLYY